MNNTVRWSTFFLVTIFVLTACDSQKSATTHIPTTSGTPCLGLVSTPINTPTSWGYGADYWDSIAISRIPTQNMECASLEDIVKELVLQWLETIKTKSPHQNCGLEEYTVDTITIRENTIAPQYDIVARVDYHVKPGRFMDCGWVSDRGIIEPNGWIGTGDTFGVYRENGYFRLIVLTGWGT